MSKSTTIPPRALLASNGLASMILLGLLIAPALITDIQEVRDKARLLDRLVLAITEEGLINEYIGTGDQNTIVGIFSDICAACPSGLLLEYLLDKYEQSSTSMLRLIVSSRYSGSDIENIRKIWGITVPIDVIDRSVLYDLPYGAASLSISPEGKVEWHTGTENVDEWMMK